VIEAAFDGRLGAFRLQASFTVPAAGVTVLFGPSGCGKTTLLRCLAGLTRLPGRLSVAGEVWQDARRFVPTHRRPIGYVFQEASLFPHLSVRRNLAFGAKRTGGVDPGEFDRVVALLDLGRLLERGAGALSGGERQRVAIGRALLSRPRLLLMDEPLASLDAARKAEVLPYLEALHREGGTPIVYVTHDLTEAGRLGDRMLVMREGAIVEQLASDGNPADDAERLARRLAEVGAAQLTAELTLSGAPAAVARLAVQALQERRPDRGE
jgi:molybdate transport system ATP-binding protein